MLKIIKEIPSDLIAPFNTFNTMFLDIETDGLSHKNKLVIIGLIEFSKTGTANLIQLFNDDYHSERDMLIELIQLVRMHNTDYYVSFNGNSFDFPFLNARFSHYKIDFHLPKAANIDLLRLSRQNQAHLGISDFKLKSVEKFVGINRNDTISGKDSILMFQAYIESKSEALKQTILLHNYDDLINMIPLLKITEHMTKVFNPHLKCAGRKWYLASVQLKSNRLTCTISLDKRLSITDLFYNSGGIFFECKDAESLLKIDTIHLTDSNTNHYHFIDSTLLYQQSLDQLDEDIKNNHLIAFNGSLFDNTIANQAFSIIHYLVEHLMNESID